MRRTLALLLALLASPALGQERPVVLIGATVHLPGGQTTEGPVLFSGGRIVSVGEAPPPAEATRLELKGHHVYAGLIDANTVLGLVEVSSVKGTVDDTEVGRINPNLRPELAVNPDSELIGVARTGGVLYAHVHARSGIITGRTALIALAGSTWEDMTVRAPVFLHLRWPAMRVDRSGRSKTEPKDQIEAREGAIRELEEAFREARAYRKARAAGAPRLERDVKWEALGDVLDGGAAVAVEANGLAQIEAALDWAEGEGLRVVLLGGADAWRAAPRLRAMKVAVVLGPVFRLPRRAYEAVHTPFQNAARLHAAGVQLAFSTGASSFAAANVRNLRDHAAMAVAHGLPEAAALDALTLSAARILGVDDRLGSIAPGKAASLFITKGPLFDFRSQVTHAWIEGKAVDLVDRQRRLYERYRKRKR